MPGSYGYLATIALRQISWKLNHGLHFPKPAPCPRVSSEIGLFLMQTPRYKRKCDIDS